MVLLLRLCRTRWPLGEVTATGIQRQGKRARQSTLMLPIYAKRPPAVQEEGNYRRRVYHAERKTVARERKGWSRGRGKRAAEARDSSGEHTSLLDTNPQVSRDSGSCIASQHRSNGAVVLLHAPWLSGKNRFQPASPATAAPRTSRVDRRRPRSCQRGATQAGRVTRYTSYGLSSAELRVSPELP